jgi:hypothetical protein
VLQQQYEHKLRSTAGSERDSPHSITMTFAPGSTSLMVGLIQCAHYLRSVDTARARTRATLRTDTEMPFVLQAVACPVDSDGRSRPPSEVMAADVLVMSPFTQPVSGTEAAVTGGVEITGGLTHDLPFLALSLLSIRFTSLASTYWYDLNYVAT